MQLDELRSVTTRARSEASVSDPRGSDGCGCVLAIVVMAVLCTVAWSRYSALPDAEEDANVADIAVDQCADSAHASMSSRGSSRTSRTSGSCSSFASRRSRAVSIDVEYR